MGCKVTLSRPSDVRIQSSSGNVWAQQRTPGEETVDEEELEQEERLRTLGTRTHAVQPCAERTSVCAALRMSICSIVEVIVPASKVNRSARFTTGKAKTPPKWRTQECHFWSRDHCRCWHEAAVGQIHLRSRGSSNGLGCAA